MKILFFCFELACIGLFAHLICAIFTFDEQPIALDHIIQTNQLIMLKAIWSTLTQFISLVGLTLRMLILILCLAVDLRLPYIGENGYIKIVQMVQQLHMQKKYQDLLL